MSEEVQISKFIADCAAQGINQPDEIKQAAINKIQEIDVQLLAADKLRPVRAQMLSVIRSFGFEVPKGARKIPVISEEATQDELDIKSLGYVLQVCKYIEENNTAQPRDLMTVCGVTTGNDFEVYSVIKWLCASGICCRTESDRALGRGPNWESRPMETKNDES